jgi:hypothetical protein
MGICAATGVAVRKAAGVQSAGESQFPVYAGSTGFIVLYMVVMVYLVGKQKRLLAEGEMAMAHVTKRWMTRKGPRILYEFTAPTGQHFSRGAADSTLRLSVGMNMPIFYDPKRPKRQLALCASLYEVVMPGER